VLCCCRQADCSRKPVGVFNNRELSLASLVGTERQWRLSHHTVRRREARGKQKNMAARGSNLRLGVHINSAHRRTVLQLPGGGRERSRRRAIRRTAEVGDTEESVW